MRGKLREEAEAEGEKVRKSGRFFTVRNTKHRKVVVGSPRCDMAGRQKRWGGEEEMGR